MVTTTLNTIREDIDTITLCSICDGLLETIKTCETVHRWVEDKLGEQIKGLGDRVAKYQKTYDQAPDGYVKNTWFPNLKVPIGAGFYLPTKWIRQCNNGNIACFTAQDGPKDPLHIIPIYTSPTTTDNTPSRLLPHWFRVVLTGLNPQFLVLFEHAWWFEDWGVATKLDCFRTYDQETATTNAKIHQLQQDIATIEHDHTLCEQWLKVSWCAEGLTNLEGLGPKSTCAKWSTHFMDEEDEDEYCMQQA
jgi:hypothetical protein